MYFLLRPQIKKHHDVVQQKPYWAEEGFKPDTLYIPQIEFQDKLVPYPIEMPPKTIEKVDTTYIRTEVVRYLPADSALGKPLNIPKYYGKYPFLVSGDFDGNEIQLTLGDTLGNIRTERFPTSYSEFKYRYTNSSMTTAQSSTRPPLKLSKNKPFVQYDKTYVEYKHDFLNTGRTVGISTGVTIKDRIRLTGFGELGLNNNIPDQAGIKVGLKVF